MTITSTYLRDLFERIVRTFVAAAVPAFVLPATQLYSMSAWKSAAIVAATTGLTAVIGIIGGQFGNPATTSVIKPISAEKPIVPAAPVEPVAAPAAVSTEVTPGAAPLAPPPA